MLYTFMHDRKQQLQGTMMTRMMRHSYPVIEVKMIIIANHAPYFQLIVSA
jgi:hypothetical protein